ncbi:Spindle assembly abnormal protein 6 [Chionoecetes opilio]|uniref:Spindle assembly abnormal protein 6 n=1 Tax=Chionoecetes opilio TaxID=41210 RepID=A0A8J5CZ85_CHIOP|nr:Spindle assembly abnormal protein 6 [Chionoecetes opilio]
MTSKVRGTALMEQDKILAEKDARLTHLSEQLQTSTSKVSELTLERDQLHKHLQDSTNKLQEQEKTLQTNENVISWLNKQLNRLAELHRKPPHGSTLSHASHTQSSIRNMGTIPPIPEEISPRAPDESPPTNEKVAAGKENHDGLDPKYLEPTKPASIGVHGLGLLRANACQPSTQDADAKKSKNNMQCSEKGRSVSVGGAERGHHRRPPGPGPRTQCMGWWLITCHETQSSESTGVIHNKAGKGGFLRNPLIKLGSYKALQHVYSQQSQASLHNATLDPLRVHSFYQSEFVLTPCLSSF